ncbi:serine/threonine-protein kinase [Streptomyces sp. MMG1121]|uniref:serine/threonine-protein kinase n=1 Tax=Streptomyces sp. MMG1121 TaxID=1415544 RepID=UPI0006B06D3A|nr:serine/threonine-protein kinase [Streptomyces sp. MMG1121]KOV60296.1 serine/threonine protein kinase [Streptomyces sp. MMG1121]
MEKLGAGDPKRIGGYRLLARLGAGGMGHVYLARSDRGRTAAVKLVRGELAEREEFRARFRQEVQAARRVGGYWTAPVLDADTEAAVPWVATGYVAGPSLQQVVGRDHGALPERSVRILAAGLAHALKDIHAAGIVHRDLKPSNVLVTIDGPRVIDFGIARALETASLGGEGLTQTGSLVGSPGFMAPEQVRGDRITQACDVFCLGSVLAYAASGTQPFGTATSGVHALMFRIAQEEPDLTGVPEGIADLVRGCLRKEPGERPSLEAILERTGAEDTVSGGRSRDPWLPGVLVAQLGRHAVRLLEVEEPEANDAAPPLPPAPPATVSSSAGAGDTGGASGPDDSGGPGGTGAAGGRPTEADAGGADGAGGSPEHAAVSDEGATSGGGGIDRQTTVVSGRLPAPGVPPVTPGPGDVPGAQGHAQQHPQYPPYAETATSSPPTAPPYARPGYSTPAFPRPGEEEPERRSGRSTALLVAVALVVALGAGGSVYALMNGGGGHTRDGGKGGSAPAVASSGPTTSAPSSSAAPGGAIPAAYLGTWGATIDSTTGTGFRQLTIRQGAVGDAVLSLVAEGPADGGGSYHCVFEARLTQQPGADGPLEIGPSTVSSGEPASSCTPGDATEITLQPGGTLKRVQKGGGESLTYSRR